MAQPMQLSVDDLIKRSTNLRNQFAAVTRDDLLNDFQTIVP